MEHQLKTWPEYYKEIVAGNKTFEIRENDRHYRVGDTLILKEFKPCKICRGLGKVLDYTDTLNCDCIYTKNPKGRYTGKKIKKVITYITDFNQKPNFVVIGFADNSLDINIR